MKSQTSRYLENARHDVGNERITLSIDGMTCASCVRHIENALRDVDGVTSGIVNLATNRATVRYIPSVVGISDLRNAIEDAGYLVVGAAGDEINELATPKELDLLKLKLLFSLAVAAAIMTTMVIHPLKTALPFRIDFALLFLATPIQFWAGRQFYFSAWRALKHRTTNMNTLIVVGTSVTYVYSAAVTFFHNSLFFDGYEAQTYFDVSTAIIGLVLLGRYFESRAKTSTCNAIQGLMELQPNTARVVRHGEEINVLVEDVVPGDHVLVRPGEKIAVDGDVVNGFSWIDESMLTGESVPAEKSPEAPVFSGTINTTGSFTFQATRTGKTTMLSQIIKLLEEAQGSKAPIQRLADLIASYFVPAVIGVATGVFVTWYIFGPTPTYVYAILTAVAVLIIACPCAMGLATPTAIMVGIGKGAQLGILIRSAEGLERTHKVQVVVIDKTGTLTTGKPSVTEIVSLDVSENELLRLAASAEHASEHPLGEAIVSSAKERNLALSIIRRFNSFPGYGIQVITDDTTILVGNQALMRKNRLSLNGLERFAAELSKQGKTVIFVALDGDVSGIIAVADIPKPWSQKSIEALLDQGLEVVMLTGDNRATAEAVAIELGICQVIADVLPGEKVRQIKSFQKKGKIVAMVGDGINDAPALAQADIGIAIGTGADIAMEAADITLVSDDLRSIATSIALSKATMRTIKQNLFLAFVYNIALIPIAAGILYPLFSGEGVPEFLQPIFGKYGFLNPILAAATMGLSSIAVVTNSLRLRSFRAR